LKVLILGMGNPIASDDAVGLLVIDRLRDTIQHPDIVTKKTERGGLTIIDLMQDFDVAIVVDSIKTGHHPPGSIIHFKVEEFDFTPRSAAVHDVSFFQAIELGRKMGFSMPEQIEIISIEIVNNSVVSEDLTPVVKAAIKPTVGKIKSLLNTII